MDLRFIGLTQCSVWYWCFIFLHPVSWLSCPILAQFQCSVWYWLLCPVSWLVLCFSCFAYFCFIVFLLFCNLICVLFCYRVDGVPCGIGTFVPSQLIIHTFISLLCYLSIFVWFEFCVHSVPCGIGTFCTQSVGYVYILSLCCVCFALIMCASNVPCGIGVPCVHPVSWLDSHPCCDYLVLHVGPLLLKTNTLFHLHSSLENYNRKG